jgi:hypothetical protein
MVFTRKVGEKRAVEVKKAGKIFKITLFICRTPSKTGQV